MARNPSRSGRVLEFAEIVASREPVATLVEREKRFLARRVFRWLPVRVGRARMRMNPQNTMSMFHYLLGSYEWRELEIAGLLIRPGDTVLDVGANIGYYTLKLSESVGGSGRVHAFEPDPTNFGILRSNVTSNGLSNVTLHNIALSDVDGSSTLYRAPDNTGDASLAPRPERTARPVQVSCLRLDSLRDSFDPSPSFIKLDVQGFELAVMRGGRGSFDSWKPRPSLLLELEPLSLAAAGSKPAELLEYLSREDYVLGRIAAERVFAISAREHRDPLAWTGDAYSLIAIPTESRWLPDIMHIRFTP